MKWAVNSNITGNGKMMKKWAVFIQILRFFHQSALILKEKHCLLSRHDYFDYSSTGFSQILEKKSGVGGVNGHRFAII